MLIARLTICFPSLAIAGLVAKKKASPISVGTFSTNTFLFATIAHRRYFDCRRTDIFSGFVIRAYCRTVIDA